MPRSKKLLASAKPRRPSALSESAALGFALFFCASCGGILSGCARPEPASQTTQSSTPKSSSAVSWPGVLQRWWQAVSKPAPVPRGAAAPNSQAGKPSKANSPQTDVALLASRHPAWKLADALEKNQVQPVRFDAIAGGAAPAWNTPDAPGFDVDFSNSSSRAPNPTNALPLPALESGLEYSTPEASDSQTFAAQTFVSQAGELESHARDAQENSLAAFLRSVAERQTDWQSDYRAVLQTTLAQDVADSAQRAPAAPVFVLPSAADQLEMSNLRLRLLNNVFSTEADREAARARSDELMSNWRAALKKQEKERAAELQRLRVEEPARLQSAGAARLQNELETIRRRQEENRDAIALEHRTRLEQDFGAEPARLALIFPAVPSDAPGVLQAASESSDAVSSGHFSSSATFLEKLVPIRTNSLRTISRGVASGSKFAGVAAATSPQKNARAGQIRALRQLAWRDAMRQVKMAERLAQ